MAYTEIQKTELTNKICLRIEKGEALRNILKEKEFPTAETFYKWLDEDENKTKQYARAKEAYADLVFEDIILIADGTDKDQLIDENGIVQVNHHVIQRDRLRVDARKWHLSKLNPKKYGDKIDVTSDGEKINQPMFGNNPLNEE